MPDDMHRGGEDQQEDKIQGESLSRQSGKPTWPRTTLIWDEPLRERPREAANEEYMRTEPRGYWTRVFDQAAALLRARPELNGDAAYWTARRMVDQSLAELESEVPLFEHREAAPALVLAP